MAYSKQTWTDGVTPVDAAHMNHIEAGIGVATPIVGTSLPASPLDGQEAILVDAVAAPTWQWRFRYDAGSSSAYKWEYIGGTPARADADANEAASSTTYAELTTKQRILVPRSGVYECRFGALTWGSITNAQGDIGIVDTTALTTALINMSTGCPTVNIAAVIHRERQFPSALTAGRTIAAVYRVGGASGTQNYAVRWFSLLPVRVA